MKKRSKIPPRKSKKMFTKHAKKVHPANYIVPNVGGLRK